MRSTAASIGEPFPSILVKPYTNRLLPPRHKQWLDGNYVGVLAVNVVPIPSRLTQLDSSSAESGNSERAISYNTSVVAAEAGSRT